MRNWKIVGVGAVLLCTCLVLAADVPVQDLKYADKAAMMSASSPAADVAGMAVVAPAKKEIVEPEQLGSAVKPEFVAKTEFEQEVVKKEPLSKVTSAALFGEGSVPSKGGGRGLTCPPDALFGQDSHEGTASWSAATSDLGPTEQYKVYENFSAVSGDIQQVHFWGLNLSWSGGWSNCDTENPMDFLIEFWDDVGGVPGTVQYGETISVLGSATGELYAGYPSYEYLAVLTTPVSGLAAGWVSIQGASIVGPPDCWFMWMSGYGLDGDSLQWDGTALTNTLYDRALCLEGVYIPTYGACCDDYTGLCDDNVEYLVCLASGGRFAEGVLCINLDPPCGPTGACCDADLVCLFTCVEADCDAVGGTWWEGEDCDAGFVCPATCEHTVTLWDSYGDGWNGNTLDVLVNGVLVLDDITILDGYGPESHIFLAATGDTITTVFTGTSWPEENCYKIYDVNMIEICRDGYDGDECYGNPPVGVTCTGNCGPPPRGACCDDSTGICTDDVSILDCPEPLRFAQDTFCIDLDPPCGGIPGACCLDGVCEATLTESDCYTLYPGATWFEWEECPGFPCPPGNDTCETAMAINEVTDLPFDTTNATTSGLGTHSINQDIFYCFTAPQDGACMFELCGSTFDTRLAVWDDCACPPTVELAYNDDNGPACSGTQSSVELSVIAGMRYLVQVGGYSDYSGPGDLTIYMRQPGACCVGIVCTIETPVSCEALGGIYLGDGTDCGPPNPCLGTCCTINVDTYPYTDDVEGGFGDWQNAFVGDDTDWTWNAGSTPSSNTGPSGDHTTGAGYYFFIEASSHTDEVAILDGPCFDLTPLATPGVVFWYHMYGDDMGTLEFQVSDDGCVTWVTLWTLSGDQGDQWYMAQVSLAGYTDVATRFVGTTGPGFASDMALDDIWVGDVGAVTGACCVGTTCTVETEDYCVNTLLGYYLGDFTNCDAPNPCSGACCDLFDCFMTSNEGDCIAAGGTEWALGETCPEYVCWPYCDICFTETGDPDDWITNVRFNTIDNTTGPEGEPCSYGDYTSISTPVAPGTTYTLEVSFDGSGTWSECVTAFFDWNRDGVFDNVTERYDLGCADCTPGTPVTVTGDITVPGDADFGLTGMRVIEQYSSPVTDPCTGSTYGETEDYLVDIQPVPGACCYPDGSCDEQLPDDCATLGGVYGGATTVCANDDCNANGVDDFCDILAGTSPDCNENGVPDECDIASGFSEDCNSNGIPDECDVASGTSEDCQPNGIPDECEVPPICPGCPDCNTNGIPDECEEDCQPNGVPDDCDVDPTDPDGNGEVSEDCQPDGIPDECQLGDGRADMIIHTSARGLNNPGGHLVALLDETGTMYGQYNQIAAAQGSTWGYRDGAYDGEYVYFGWDTGVAQHDPDGANGVQIITGGAPSGVGTWRALAYDPTSSFGAPGFWVACWASDLIKVDMAGNLLQAWPDDGWSLYGLAYDEATGMLWGHGMPGDTAAIIEIDPSTGLMTGVQWSSEYGFPGATQGGLELCGAFLYGVIQASPTDQVFSCDMTGALDGPITPNPRDLDGQTGETGNLGIAVVCPPAGADCNTNGIPDECDVPPICSDPPPACSFDCQPDLIPDECQLEGNDCNTNGIPDECDIASGFSEDCQPDGIPDECQLYHNDCNGNDIPDECDIASGFSEDCNTNEIPDECDIASGFSEDCQPDGIPDECQLGTGVGPVLLDEDFVDITVLPDWHMINHSEPLGTTDWFQGNSGVFPSQAGDPTAYIATNYNNCADGTISNWLLTPELTLEDGMTLTFYTRTADGSTWPDRMQIRMSLNGASTDVGTTCEDVGDFTTLWLDINEFYTVGGYPETWDDGFFTVNLSGIGAPTNGRLAFRYYVHDAGPNGTNSNYIGLDTVVVRGIPAATNDCNLNGVPDECDIPPICTDPWPLCSLDSNENEVPDECEPICLGDSNCDGHIDWRDIQYLVEAMDAGNGVELWKALFAPALPTCTYLNNDINGDLEVNWKDVDPFVAIINTTCP